MINFKKLVHGDNNDCFNDSDNDYMYQKNNKNKCYKMLLILHFIHKKTKTNNYVFYESVACV